MITLKEKLKKIKCLREAKYATDKVINVVKFSICRLLQFLPFSSTILGPPKGYVNSLADFVTDYSMKHPGSKQIYHHLGSENVSIKELSRKIIGDKYNYTLNKKEFQYTDFLSTIKPGRVYWDCYCIIGPDDQLLTEVSNWWGSREKDHKVFRQFKLPKVHKLKGSAFLLGATNDSNYAHFITETLTKFKLLNDCGISIHDFSYILMYGQPNALHMEMFQLFNISQDKVIYVDHFRHIEVEELTIAPIFWRQRPWIGGFLKSLFSVNNLSLTGKRRIYISRRNAKARKVLNEEQVLEVLSQYGFECLINENYSIAQQAAIFTHAEIVIGSHGAGLTNIVFCQPGTKVVEFRAGGYANFHLDYFAVISHYEKLHHYLQLCKAVAQNDYTDRHDLNFHVDIDELKEMLSCVLEDRNIKSEILTQY